MQLLFAGADSWFDQLQALEHYMVAEAAKYKPNLLWKLNEILPGLPRVLCVAANIVILAFGIVFLPEASSGGDPIPCILFASFFLPAFYLLVWGKMREPARWNSYPLTENFYRSRALNKDEHIPDFAYQLTQDIKARIPKAWFVVQVLEQNRVNLDPVLVCIVGEDKYPVKVWRSKDEVVLPQN
jgi:hypothetical protein